MRYLVKLSSYYLIISCQTDVAAAATTYAADVGAGTDGDGSRLGWDEPPSHL